LSKATESAGESGRKRKRNDDDDADRIAALRAALESFKSRKFKPTVSTSRRSAPVEIPAPERQTRGVKTVVAAEDAEGSQDQEDDEEMSGSESADDEDSEIDSDQSGSEDEGSIPHSDAEPEASNHGQSDSENSDDDDEDDNNTATKKKSKKAPMEMSSKRPVSRNRTVIATKNRVVRDPRFDAISAKSDVKEFNKNYDFIHDYRKEEIQELQDKIKAFDKPVPKRQRKFQPQYTAEEKEEMKKRLQRMKDQERAKLEKQRLAEVERRHNEREKELVKAGKKSSAYFLKQCKLCVVVVGFALAVILLLTWYLPDVTSRNQAPCPGGKVQRDEEQRPLKGDRSQAQEGGIQRKEGHASRQTLCGVVVVGWLREFGTNLIILFSRNLW